jgi:outer membrane protein
MLRYIKIIKYLSIYILIVHWQTFVFAEDKLYYRIAGGLATDTDLQKIVRGDLEIDDRHTGILGFELGKPLVEDVYGLPVDLVAKVGLIRHFERGLQDDFNQYTLSIKAYYKKFPWSNKIRTRLGLANGLSYADQIPFVERESLEGRKRNTSHLLHHMDLSFDMNLGDIFNSKTLKDCFFGIAISHRSGMFGKVSFYGDVDGGSNYNMFSIECLR